jgi:hypothetical protein
MTRSWIHFTRGRFVRQARVGLGDLREEHLSRQGFAGPVAMLYRTDGPNEVVRFEGDYRPRQVDDSADVVAPDASDPRGGWQTLLSNDEVAVAISRRREAMPTAIAIWRAIFSTSCIAAAVCSRPSLRVFTFARTNASIEAAELSGMAARRMRLAPTLLSPTGPPAER